MEPDRPNAPTFEQHAAAIHVLVADGHPLVCRALVRLLSGVPDVEVVATATDGPTALEMTRQFRPAVVLLDIGTRPQDGLGLARSLRRQEPGVQIVVVSIYNWLRGEALAAGACRFLLKDDGREAMVSAIRQAAQHQCESSVSGPA